jgi:hypothetical protein
MPSVCEQACAKVDSCAVAGACDLAAPFLPFDIKSCSDQVAECASQCIVDADCGAIASLLPGSPVDMELQGCIQGCLPPCQGCSSFSCGMELQACSGDSVGDCPAFVMCTDACTDGDGACIQNCATMHPGDATDALLACIQTNCSQECLGGAGGAGGAGGSGGAGGN